jgi:predicted ATP-grasp superfamily ATP-dependent carboligase
MITKEGFEHFRADTITGIPATLLNEGSLMGLDVIVLLVNTSADGPPIFMLPLFFLRH